MMIKKYVQLRDVGGTYLFGGVWEYRGHRILEGFDTILHENIGRDTRFVLIKRRFDKTSRPYKDQMMCLEVN